MCSFAFLAAMAKANRKPQPPSKGRASQAVKPNLFEHLYNRKKFNILGKKTQGSKQSGKNLNDAVEKASV